MLRVVEQAFRSDTGRQRTANEDSLFARAPLFAVADGMGGAQAGEVASRIAVESFEAEGPPPGSSAEAQLRAIAEAANERIHSLALHDSTRSGMGTTLTAALVEGGEVSIAHVGDSRAYVYRDRELKLLTSDHSLVEELRRQGRLTDAQAEEHPQRSIITRALGPEADVEIDTLTLSARPGDVFLLCSDGLTSMIKDDRIAAILAATASLDEAASSLVQAANEAGGRDNITVVVFRLEEAEAGAPIEEATLIGPSAEEAGLSGATIRDRAAREPVRRRGARTRGARWKTAAKIAVAAVLLAVVVIGAVLGARSVYFLGTDEGGRLALYRGLPYELPFDIDLYSEVYSTGVQVASLPDDRRDEATDHALRGRDDAVDLLHDLEADAAPSAGGQGDSVNQERDQDGGRRAGGDRRGRASDESSGGGGAERGSREAGLSGRKSQGSTSAGDAAGQGD